MKKIAFINTYCNGSTGGLISIIADYLPRDSFEIKKYYGRSYNAKKKDWTFIGENHFSQKISNLLTYITGMIGSFHKSSTKKLIKHLNSFKPDIIHIHNIHGNYLNFKMLGKYLHSFKGKIIFTMHDEFFLSGRCALLGCDKWKNGCYSCKHKDEYPHALIDKSAKLQKNKNEFIEKLNNPIFVFPSKWLFKLFGSRFPNAKKIVINNGIKIDPNTVVSKKKKETIKLLCVANPWSVDKGSQIINNLSEKLPSKYEITVVGSNKKTSRLFGNKIKQTGILGKEVLRDEYLSSDIFINPTLKDNFPTVLLESLSYGLPVITFNTGGCSEIVDESCGVVTSSNDSIALYNAIISFDFEKYSSKKCIDKAITFDAKICASKYLEVYLK